MEVSFAYPLIYFYEWISDSLNQIRPVTFCFVLPAIRFLSALQFLSFLLCVLLLKKEKKSLQNDYWHN